MCGNPRGQIDLKDFVLEKIDNSHRKIIDSAVKNATCAIEEIIENGIDVAMNKFN